MEYIAEFEYYHAHMGGIPSYGKEIIKAENIKDAESKAKELETDNLTLIGISINV